LYSATLSDVIASNMEIGTPDPSDETHRRARFPATSPITDSPQSISGKESSLKLRSQSGAP
jgi:hypothetical protein